MAFLKRSDGGAAAGGEGSYVCKQLLYLYDTVRRVNKYSIVGASVLEL